MYLPAKAPLQGVTKVRTLESGYKLLSMGESHPTYLGIEYESNFSPFTNQARKIKEFFIRYNLLKRASSYVDLLAVIKKEILYNASGLLHPSVDVDAKGLEVKTHACTLSVFKHCKEELNRILRIYRLFGFDDLRGGDGIHLNIDKAAFGHNVAVQRRSFKNFLWFLYRSIDFMIEFSNRKTIDSRQADLFYHLGDVLGNVPKKGLEALFLSEKGILLRAFDNNVIAESLNMVINKEGRPAIEFRWMGSTHDVDVLMSMIEFMFCVANYCQSYRLQSNVNLKTFCNYVFKQQDEYPHLYARLVRMHTTKDVIGTMWIGQNSF